MAETAAAAPAPATSGGSGSSGGGSPPPASSSGSNGAPNGAGSPPAEGGTAGESAAQVARRLSRVEKVNGKEIKLEATEEELWAAKRRETAVHENARKVAEERKKHAAEVEAWKDRQRLYEEDPYHALREKNPNFDELAFHQERLHRLLQEQNRDPRDLELSAKDQEIARMKRAEQARVQKEQQAKELDEENAQLRRDGALIAGALKKGKLPIDDLTLDLTLKAKYEAEDLGFDLTEEELAGETRKLMTSALDNCADTMDDAALLESFPKLAKKIHRALLAKYKAMRDGGQQPTTPPPAPRAMNGQRPPEQKGLTEREQFKQMEAAAGRRILRTGV